MSLASALPALAQGTPKEVRVEGGSVLLDPPKAWKMVVSGPSFGPTVHLTPAGAGDFEVLVTALVSRKRLPDDLAIERSVRDSAQRQLSTALQKTIDVQPIRGAEARGYMFHVTQKAPESGPGDFRELHQGTVLLPPLILTVTVLTHSGDQATVDNAMRTIAGARYRSAK